MPPRVYQGRSAFEFRPPGGGCVTLCPLGSARSFVWSRYNEALAENSNAGTIGRLIDEYFRSPKFKELAPETQKSYERYRKAGKIGLDAAFSKMRCDALEPKHVRRYMDLMGARINARTGAPAKALANRHLSLLSTICGWGRQRGYIATNPCDGVDKYSERARDRYVTDDEYFALYKMAPVHIQATMEIAYLCAARLSDVLALTTFQIREEGLFIRQGKTGKKQIKSWSPRLKEAVEMCRSIAPPGTTRVICNKSGRGYTRDGFESAVTRLKNSLKEKGVIINWTMHDLKAKSISDYSGDKLKFSGHSSQRMLSVYNRKIEIVETLGSNEEADGKKS